MEKINIKEETVKALDRHVIHRIYLRYMEKAIINIKTDKKKKVDTNIYQMTPKLERLIGRIRKDFKNKKNISGPFSTAEEMDAYLNKL